jgi:soluble P-type ATPase
MVGKSRAGGGGFYISTLVKQAIAEELKALGKNVIAIGDSPIDIGMLEAADKGFIVAVQKLGAGVMQYFVKNPKTKIRQLSYSQHKYKGIKEVGSIWQ